MRGRGVGRVGHVLLQIILFAMPILMSPTLLPLTIILYGLAAVSLLTVIVASITTACSITVLCLLRGSGSGNECECEWSRLLAITTIACYYLTLLAIMTTINQATLVIALAVLVIQFLAGTIIGIIYVRKKSEESIKS